MGKRFSSIAESWRDAGYASAILLVMCLALLSAETSFNMRSVSFEKGVAAALNILSGHPELHEWQNRILFPLWLRATQWLGGGTLDAGRAWRVARFGAAAISYLGAYLALLRITKDARAALAGIALVTYAYLWTAGSAGWEAGGDFFDILFSALFVWFAVEKKYSWMALAVLIAAANRESAMFGGIVWASMTAAREGFAGRLKDYLFALFCVGLGALAVYILRVSFAPGMHLTQELGIVILFRHWRWLLMPFGTVTAMAAVVFPLAWIAGQIEEPFPPEAIGLVWATIICGCVTLLFGIAGELRIWLPCVVFAVSAICMGLAESDEGEDFLGLRRTRDN